MNNIDLTLEMLLEESEEEVKGGNVKRFLEEASKFFAKIFKVIKNFFRNVINKIAVRVYDIEKAFNKHRPENGDMKFIPKQNVALIRNGEDEIGLIEWSIDQTLESLIEYDSEQLLNGLVDEGLSTSEERVEEVKNIGFSATVDKLGEFIQLYKKLSKHVLSKNETTKQLLNDASESISNEDVEKVKLAKLRTKVFNTIIKKVAGILNRLAIIAISAINDMRDEINNPTLESNEWL